MALQLAAATGHAGGEIIRGIFETAGLVGKLSHIHTKIEYQYPDLILPGRTRAFASDIEPLIIIETQSG